MGELNVIVNRISLIIITSTMHSNTISKFDWLRFPLMIGGVHGCRSPGTSICRFFSNKDASGEFRFAAEFRIVERAQTSQCATQTAVRLGGPDVCYRIDWYGCSHGKLVFCVRFVVMSLCGRHAVVLIINVSCRKLVNIGGDCGCWNNHSFRRWQRQFTC